jgi:peptidoglycan/LPS O-acetylase OafA/YrhL
MPDAGLQGKDALQLGSLEESNRHTKEPRFYLPQRDALRFFASPSVFFLHTLPAIVGTVAGLVGLGVRTGPNHSIVNLLISCGVILPATLLGTIVLASLSYRFLERPFLLMKDRFAFVHSRGI